MGYIIFWLLCGVIAGMIGEKKGEGCLSFFIGVIFGPFGILFALLSRGNQVTCPFCKELIKKDATVCKHCGRSLAAAGNHSEQWRDPMKEREEQQKRVDKDLETFRCPHCSTVITHSENRKQKGTCPSCGRQIDN